MQLAFCLYKYFPYGGLQSNFINIAKACQLRGHKIRVYVMDWSGETPADFEIVKIPATKYINYNKQKDFAELVSKHLSRHPVDLVIGFNKIPFVDIYYAADNCLAEKQQGKWINWLPRYAFLLSSERELLTSKNLTVMAISEQQISDFNRHYKTPLENIRLLPPGIRKDCLYDESCKSKGDSIRQSLNLTDEQYLLLAVGSGFKTKGLDRSIKAIARLPEKIKKQCKFVVIGKDTFTAFKRLAAKMGIGDRVIHIDGAKNIADYLFAADLLLHPAYNEAAGMVLLEAGIAGLPVLVSENCGFSRYVSEYRFGQVIPQPFNEDVYVKMLTEMLESDRLSLWSENGIRFGREADIFSRAERAADLIEERLRR
jgi:UDP-glucose:(heptosyl)LPS alpha-1,3-glucosyltransferase